MTGRLWPSALVAALFAIHPLQVESVAWVVERKGVLSGLFFVLTLGVYVNYVRHPRSLARYATVVVLFAAGLMSKSMVVTLPAVLLLLDYWPLGRFAGRPDRHSTSPPCNGEAAPAASSRQVLLQRFRSWGPLVLEKIPLLALAAVFSLQSMRYEKEGETVFPEEHVALAWRLGNGLVSYVAYLSQTVYPVRLTPLYLHPGVDLPVWKNHRRSRVVVGYFHRGAGILAAVSVFAHRLAVVLGNAVAGQRSGRVRGRSPGHGRPLYVSAADRAVSCCRVGRGGRMPVLVMASLGLRRHVGAGDDDSDGLCLASDNFLAR